jgi:2'-5' RNA ligase
MGEQLRLFVSVEVAVSDAMRSAMAEIGGTRNIRSSKEDQIHITLSFLGDTPSERVPGLVANLRESLSGTSSFGLSLKGVGAFPNVRRPRVVWIGIDGGRDELALLADRVRGAVAKSRLRQDDKPFSPHVTVGRVQGPADVSELERKYRDTVFSEFTVGSVRLMRSVLAPSGASHTVVEDIALL